MAAASVPVIIALIGGGLDMSRVYKARNRLQSACDAGTLAGRRAVSTNGYGTAEKAQAATFFNTNFVSSDVGAKDTTFVTTSTDSGNLVKGTATTKVETAVMDIFGFDTIDVTVNCSATMGVGNSDITMVLDTTGSMGSTLSGTSETRIQALRAAMKNFYTTVANATQGSNARVRYSFVPYSSSVNVGKLILDRDPNFLVDEWPIQSREAVFKTITEKVFTGWNNPVFSSSEAYSTETDSNAVQYSNTNYNNNSSCNSALPNDVPWANNGSPTTNAPTTTTNGSGQQVVTTRTDQPQRKTTFLCQRNGSNRRIFYYYTYRTHYSYAYQTSDPVYEDRTREEFSHFAYKQINYDVSGYKKFQSVSVKNGTSGASVSYLWKGCIEERETEASGSFSYSSLTGMSPSGAYDLNIDDSPDDNDDATKWAPMWPEVAYYRTYTSSGNTYLSTSPETTNGSRASSYCPYRAQLLQAMSKASFDAYADALSPEGSTYHDIGMLWGLRLNSPEGPWQSLVNDPPSNGGKVSRHIIFMTDGEMAPSYTIQSIYGIEWHDRRITIDGSANQAARHTARFRALCDAAKAKGFRVWVIAFASSMTTDLSYCASSNSAYTASSSAQLNTAFQEIAKNVGELRIYQ